VSPDILRPLLLAARDNQRIEVDYVSVNNPNREGRIIAPHTLVWTGLRWHVRGWCEKNRDFRDFVLSRFRGQPELLGPAPHTAQDDTNWNVMIKLTLKPDPRLTPQQQEVVAIDYGMQNGQLVIPVRARLVNYLLQLLNINAGQPLADPRAQQVIIANSTDIKPWLLG
jgi:predicted DNA-binding transcriptional regulator YafY